MKLENKRSDYIKIKYFGIELSVSSKAKYIATDSDGNVYEYLTYSYKPPVIYTPIVKGFSVWSLDSDGKKEWVAKVDLEGRNWKTTLKEIEVCKN